MPAERRKPRPKLKTRALVASVNDAPERQAQTLSSRNTSRQNLKLSDWLTVFAYIDMHPTLSQTEVVKHFATLQSGALVFTQPTLSRKLQERSDLEQHTHDNPSTLDSKRRPPRVVTRPDVERALFLWVKHMEAKGEQVNGPMLKEKRCKFEELFNVPEEERLQIRTPARPTIPQLAIVEKDISEAISELQARNRIVGTPPTLDEFIEPKEELEDPDSTADIVEGGDKAIVAKVVQEMAEQNGEVISVDSDDDDESGTPGPDIPRGEAINLCERLEEACLQHSDATNSNLVIGLLSHLRRFRGFLRRREELIHEQTTLDDFFTPQSHQSSEPST